MGKIKEAMLEQEAQDQVQMAKDMDLFIKEHDAGFHKDGIVPFCERCEEDRRAKFEDHDCHLSGEDGCDCQACKSKYHCEICKDTGEIEIMGGSDADEWGVVDVKRCSCQED